MKNKYTCSASNLKTHSRPLSLDSNYGHSLHVLNVTGKHPFGNTQELEMYTYTQANGYSVSILVKRPRYRRVIAQLVAIRGGAYSPRTEASSFAAVDLVAPVLLVPLLPGGAAAASFYPPSRRVGEWTPHQSDCHSDYCNYNIILHYLSH